MKNKIFTSFVVEDSPLALEMIIEDIRDKYKFLELIGSASNVLDAAKQLNKQQPDILFLDIMLGNNTAFDLLEIVPNLNSKIIFVTASDSHAIKAFKFAAIDYVLKPYSDEDLSNAISKAIEQIKPNKDQLRVLNEAINKEKQPLTKISLHTLHKVVVVDINNIVRCQSDNNYTMFYFNDDSRILVSKTLKYYADILKEVNFLRVHQSHLINKSYIKEFIKSDGGYIVLKDKKTIPVSVRKRAEILESLKKF